MEIGSKIKEKREQKHWSQDELAEILNISKYFKMGIKQSLSKY